MSRPVNSSSRADWRLQTVKKPTGRARWPKRIFFTLLTTGLIALLIWLVWLPGFPISRFDILPVFDYDPVHAPAPAALSDLGTLQEVWPDAKIDVLEELEDSHNIAALSSRFGTGKNEVLILFVSAQGISDHGTAYLLCSDYMRNAAAGESGRYKLSDLLDQVRQCPAKLKLVILDVVHEYSDPRLGMLANEFPRLLEEEVRKKDDSGLWVLSGGRPLERRHVAPATRRSVLGQAVEEGLGRAGDADGDRVIDLNEFHEFVSTRVAAWVDQRNDWPDTQHPVLLWGGGAVSLPLRNPPKLLILSKKPPVADAKPSEKQTAAEKVEKQLAADPAAEGHLAKARAIRPKVKALLSAAWTKRDEFQARQGKGQWSPADYAPHLWRLYQQELLGYEMRYRYDNDLSNKLAELRAMGMAVPEAEGGESRLGWLVAARERAQKSAAGGSYAELPQDWSGIEEAVKLRNRVLFSVPYYLRWHSQVSWTSSRRLASYDPLSRLVREQLPVFTEMVESFENQGRSETPSGPSVQDRLRDLDEKKTDLERTVAELDEMLKRDTRDALDTAGRASAKGSATSIGNLLSTPLLSLSSREKLLDALDRFDDSFPEQATAIDATAEIPLWRWDRLVEQAELEIAQVRLAEPDFEPKTALLPLLQGATAERETARWDAFRQLGRQLQVFYESIPTKIQEDVKNSELSRLHHAARLLRLIDARDVQHDRKGLDAACEAVGIFAVSLPPRPQAHATIVDGENKELRRDREWTAIEVRLATTGLPQAEAALTLDYRPTLLEVRDPAGNWSAEPGEPVRVPLDHGAATLKLQVRPRDVIAWSPTSLSVLFRAGGETAGKQVKFDLPGLDAIDLVVQRVADDRGTMRDEPGQKTSDARAAVVTCNAFPRRETEFFLNLRNRSMKEREVTVECRQAPEGWHRPGEERHRPFDLAGRWLPSFESLAGPSAVKLPANEALVPVAFVEPKPPAKKEEPAAKEAAKAPEKPSPSKAPAAKDAAPGQPEGKPMPAGIVCVVRPAGAGSAQSSGPGEKKEWIFWLDFRPTPPLKYVVPEVKYVQGKIDIRVRALRDSPFLPPLSEKQPIEVSWDVTDEIRPSQELVTSGKITSPDGEIHLSAPPAPDARLVPVRLTVDGCPRAFIYQVRVDREGELVRATDNPFDLRIVAPRNGDVFPVPPPAGFVQFQVDTPSDAFLDPQDAVEVWLTLVGDPTPIGKKQFRSDRAVDTRLREINPKGLIRVYTEVSDYRVSFDPGRIHGKVEVHGLLSLTHPKREVPRSVSVSMRSFPPQIARIDVPPQVYKDSEFQASVKLKDDLNVIGRLEFGFDLNDNRRLEEAERIGELLPPNLGQPAVLPTKSPSLQAGKVYHLIVKATDKVGLTAEAAREIQIVAPAPPQPKAEAMAESPGTILVEVYSTRGDPRDVHVSSDDLKRAPELRDGDYVFTGVKPGAYTIKATGEVGNSLVKRNGSETVTVEGGKTVRVRVQLQ